MKPEELMIGDLVMASTYDEELDDEVFHPARLTAISSIQELFDGNWNIEWLDDCESESVADLEPIPLTEEILKANGFKIYRYDFYEHRDTCLCVKIWKDTYFDISCIDDADPLLRCRYVHELQHALRLCGLNDLANNFKLS